MGRCDAAERDAGAAEAARGGEAGVPGDWNGGRFGPGCLHRGVHAHGGAGVRVEPSSGGVRGESGRGESGIGSRAGVDSSAVSALGPDVRASVVVGRSASRHDRHRAGVRGRSCSSAVAGSSRGGVLRCVDASGSRVVDVRGALHVSFVLLVLGGARARTAPDTRQDRGG